MEICYFCPSFQHFLPTWSRSQWGNVITSMVHAMKLIFVVRTFAFFLLVLSASLIPIKRMYHILICHYKVLPTPRIALVVGLFVCQKGHGAVGAQHAHLSNVIDCALPQKKTRKWHKKLLVLFLKIYVFFKRPRSRELGAWRAHTLFI